MLQMDDEPKKGCIEKGNAFQKKKEEAERLTNERRKAAATMVQAKPYSTPTTLSSRPKGSDKGYSK